MDLINRSTKDISDCIDLIAQDLVTTIPKKLKYLLKQNPTTLEYSCARECKQLTIEYLQNSTVPDTRDTVALKRLLCVAHQHIKENAVDYELQDKLYEFTMLGISAIQQARIERSLIENKKNLENNNNNNSNEPIKDYISGEIFLHVNMRQLSSNRFKETNNTIWLERVFYHGEQIAEKNKYNDPAAAAKDYNNCQKVAYKLYKLTDNKHWKEQSIMMQSKLLQIRKMKKNIN